MIKLAILGCTGSIGTTTINIVKRHPDLFKVVFLANSKNRKGIINLAKIFDVKTFFCEDGLFVENGVETTFEPTILSKPETYLDADIVVNGIAGIAGLLPTVAAIYAGKIIATANKESIVCAGNYINNLLHESKSELRPLDSEHSTVWQCLDGINIPTKIILTASGGAFRDKTIQELKSATAEEALKHPNWVMGTKVTIDCATLVNKGMEIVEAKRLFHIDNVEAVLHRESVIHALIETEDGALIAGMSCPDMEVPIQYALTYPNRKKSNVKKLDLSTIGALTFDKIDEKRFPCFSLWKQASEFGDYAGCVLNAANEIAVDSFVKHKLDFYGIYKCAENAISKFGWQGEVNDIKDAFSIDKEVKEYTLKSIQEI